MFHLPAFESRVARWLRTLLEMPGLENKNKNDASLCNTPLEISGPHGEDYSGQVAVRMGNNIIHRVIHTSYLCDGHSRKPRFLSAEKM